MASSCSVSVPNIHLSIPNKLLIYLLVNSLAYGRINNVVPSLRVTAINESDCDNTHNSESS